MKVLCSIDTDTGEISTTADGKHMPHTSFSIASYLDGGGDDGFSNQYGYYSYCSEMDDGSSSSTSGSLIAGDPKSHKQTNTFTNMGKAMAKLIKSIFLLDGVAGIFKAKK